MVTKGKERKFDAVCQTAKPIGCQSAAHNYKRMVTRPGNKHSQSAAHFPPTYNPLRSGWKWKCARCFIDFPSGNISLSNGFYPGICHIIYCYLLWFLGQTPPTPPLTPNQKHMHTSFPRSPFPAISQKFKLTTRATGIFIYLSHKMKIWINFKY